MRIIITGAHGTGKTTLVTAIKATPAFYHYGIVPSARQKLLDLGIPHSELGSELTQRVYMEHCLSYKDHYNVICDRCVVDVLAYTHYLFTQNKVSNDFALGQEKIVRDYFDHQVHTDKIFFLEPEFDILEQEHPDGGVRTIDKEYQQAISDNIENILDTLEISYALISGCPTKRLLSVLEKLS
jgi:predicted ATPase